MAIEIGTAATGNSAIQYGAIPGDTFTAMGWMKNVNGGNYQGICNFGDAGSEWDGLWFEQSSAYGIALLNGANRTAFFTAVEDEWFFFCLVVDASASGAEMSGYCRAIGDTTLTSDTGVARSSGANPNEFNIATSTFNEEVPGDLCYVKIWDAALTEDEILAESRFIRPIRLDNLWAFIPAWSEIDTTDGTDTGDLRDHSGNGNHGPLSSDSTQWAPIDDVLGTNIPVGVAYGGRVQQAYQAFISEALVGATSVDFTSASALTATGSLRAASSIDFSSTAALTGVGSLAAATSVDFTSTATLTEVTNNALVASSSIDFTSTASLTATGALRAASSMDFTSTSALTATGALRSATSIDFEQVAILSDANSADLAASTDIAFTASGTLTATGALRGESIISFLSTASLGDGLEERVSRGGGGFGPLPFPKPSLARISRRPQPFEDEEVEEELEALVEDVIEEVEEIEAVNPDITVPGQDIAAKARRRVRVELVEQLRRTERLSERVAMKQLENRINELVSRRRLFFEAQNKDLTAILLLLDEIV